MEDALAGIAEIKQFITPSSILIHNMILVVAGVILGIGGVSLVHKWVTNGEGKGRATIAFIVGLTFYIIYLI